MTSPTTYDKTPYVPVSPSENDCAQGWEEILDRLRPAITRGRMVLCVECYPGVFENELIAAFQTGLPCALVVRAEEALRGPEEIDRMLGPHLTDDPVFGIMNPTAIEDFFDSCGLRRLQQLVAAKPEGTILVVGTGASLIVPDPDVLLYADLARWTIQQRQRSNQISNLGTPNHSARPGEKYKRAFFVDWRAADRLKTRLFERIDYLLDTNIPETPKMISGASFREGLALAARRPFRVVPLFDPGPWGGHWMQETFALSADEPNFAWGFDCVPEENSLLLAFGSRRVEVPALDLVLRHPRELLGDSVYRRFGAEFPIRFDLLDTMGGGNLSLQVHPLTAYIRDCFRMEYTQDESYYMLQAGKDATVFLGLKEGIDSSAMATELRHAQNGGGPFQAGRFVNSWPARKHDHFLIPAGTVHCSGANGVVLEISATPYIFTFKLWDWGRLGLDGRPRPVHLDYGLANIQWDRTIGWVRENLVNRTCPLGAGDGWREERTGLHSLEFIETRRHWFTAMVPHHTRGNLNVLNLVEGEAAVVESPTGCFDPFVVHYAETFIVPAAVGPYTIRPATAARLECATIKAYVRDGDATF